MTDEFSSLSDGPSHLPRAEIAMDVGTWGGANFTAKVSVRVTCLQDQATMDRAAGMAFTKAVEYLKDSWDILNTDFAQKLAQESG